MKRDKTRSWPVRFLCSYYLENFLTVPDFIAYRFEDRETVSNTICRKLWGMQGVSWTIGAFFAKGIERREGYLRRNCPHIVRGQLAEDSVARDKTHSWFTRFICAYYLENFLTLPDFIAYRFEDRENTSITLCRRLWGLQGVSWTIRSPEDFKTAVQEGWLPIFEGFDPYALGL